MKRGNIVLALLLVMTMHAGAAQAELSLFIGKNTITKTQAQALAKTIETQLGETVEWDMQTEEDSFSKRVMDGDAPHLAVLCAGEIAPWAQAGMLMPMDGAAGELETVSEIIVSTCVADEHLFAIPLGMRRHSMAVDPAWLEKIRMGYLLDERMYPAWNYAQVLQMLDELALKSDAGLEVWPPAEEDTLCIEALLQGICGNWFEEGATDAAAVDMEGLEAAFVWLTEMEQAGLIQAAESREAALERFIHGETAIFIDWTPEDSLRYAKEIEEGRIRLVPYPSATGIPFTAAEVIGMVVPVASEEEAAGQARRAAELLGGGAAQKILGETLSGTAEMDYLKTMSMLKGGATLRALFAQAIGDILSGDIPAKEAAQRIGRVMQAMTR